MQRGQSVACRCSGFFHCSLHSKQRLLCVCIAEQAQFQLRPKLADQDLPFSLFTLVIAKRSAVGHMSGVGRIFLQVVLSFSLLALQPVHSIEFGSVLIECSCFNPKKLKLLAYIILGKVTLLWPWCCIMHCLQQSKPLPHLNISTKELAALYW